MRDIVLKALIILPIIAFVDYVIMAVVGCASCALGSTSNFYQCAFCTIGKLVLGASILLFIGILYFEMRTMKQRNKQVGS